MLCQTNQQKIVLFVTSLHCVIFPLFWGVGELGGGGGSKEGGKGILAVLGGVWRGGGIYLFWEVFREEGDARNWGNFAFAFFLGGGV